MNKKQYNNVIEWTVNHEQSAQTEDGLGTARAIFNNMGVALPNGDVKEVYETIKTDNYMGWKSCTMQEAQQAADNGIAAIGISEDRIVVLCANDEEEPVTETASVMTLSENTSAYAVDGLAYYSYRCATTTCGGSNEQGGDTTTDGESNEEGGETETTQPIYLVDQLTGVQTFSQAEDGEKYLSKNFKVKEFRSSADEDEIKIDMALVEYLQEIRDWAGASISIRSGYRTPKRNAEVGGSSKSQHMFGKAADIVCSSKTPLQLARKAESLGMLGIEWGIDGNYTHVDTRSVKWYTKYKNKVFIDVSSFYNETEPA